MTIQTNSKLTGVSDVSYATDSNGNVTGLVGSDGYSALNFVKASVTPYKMAFWGDSRYNATIASSFSVMGSGTLITQYRTPTWVLAHMGDAEYSETFAVSGDAALNWASASRATARTFANLNNSDVDVVFVQYGINDIDSGGKTSEQVIGYLKALCSEIVKSGKYLVFESILPVNSPIASFASKQITINEVNDAMQIWVEVTFPNKGIYVDTSSLLKDANGYANYTYISSGDGIHQNNYGAYICGKKIATDVRRLLPRRLGLYKQGINLINQISPSPILSQFNSVEQGTATVTQSQGVDGRGFYYQWIITPTALNGNNLWQVRMESNANFQTAAPPFVALKGNEIIQGCARIIVEDTFGSVPDSIINVELRQRFYTGSIFSDWCGIVGVPTVIDTIYPERIDVTVHTPKLINTTASVVANPSVGAGLTLATFVQGQGLNNSVVVKVYNPQIRIVDYVKTLALTAAGFALPASTVAYTNASRGNQQVTIGGGTVSAIAVNGTTTGLTSGAFTLTPTDTITPTYTVAPTWTVNQI